MTTSLTALKQRILQNTFVDTMRIEMRIDEAAYQELCESLTDLAVALKGVGTIDKDLALALYSIPLMVRNAFVSFEDHPEPKPEKCARLEDQWVELDALVTDCLAD